MTDTPAAKSEFMLLFRNTQLEKRLTEDTMREAMQRLNAWLSRWSEKGSIKSGQPLGDDGRVISGTQQRSVADGPYAEAKEAVGGYVMVLAADIEEAMSIAGEWPLLDYDATVEVRPIMKQCAGMERSGMKLVELGS
ncbi:MAG: YciI family protein [Chthoniobacteraceae bacterium]